MVIFCQNTEAYKHFFCISNASFCFVAGDYFFPAMFTAPLKCMFLFFKRISRCALCYVVNRFDVIWNSSAFTTFFCMLFFHFFSSWVFFPMQKKKEEMRICWCVLWKILLCNIFSEYCQLVYYQSLFLSISYMKIDNTRSFVTVSFCFGIRYKKVFSLEFSICIEIWPSSG